MSVTGWRVVLFLGLVLAFVVLFRHRGGAGTGAPRVPPVPGGSPHAEKRVTRISTLYWMGV